MAQLQRTFALLLLSDRGFVDPSDMLQVRLLPRGHTLVENMQRGQALFQASGSFEIGVQVRCSYMLWCA